MARSFTMADAIRRAKKKSDMDHSRFMDDQDWIDFFNEAYTDLYDLLIEAGQNYFVEEAFITVGSTTDIYDMPADFYKIIAVDWEVAQGSRYIPIRRFMETERNTMLGQISTIPAGRVRIRYAPAPPVYTDAEMNDSIDGIAGYEKMIVTHMAKMALDSEESDSGVLTQQWQMYVKSIREAAMERDLTLPSRITDVYIMDDSMYYPSLKYRLYGDQIRFLSTTWVGVT